MYIIVFLIYLVVEEGPSSLTVRSGLFCFGLVLLVFLEAKILFQEFAGLAARNKV